MIANSGEYRKKNGQRGCVMMNNFIFENKTKVYFGKGGVKEYLGGLLANFGETVMLAYGGGSIKRNGVYDEIMGILNAQGKCVVEFSGIMSNPTYAKVQEGAKLARENHVDLILAVGGGSVSAAGWSALWEYALFIAALFVTAAAIGRRSPPPVQMQTPVERRKLSKRTKAAAALILVGVPAILFVGSYYFDVKNYYLMALLVLLACMLPFFMVFEGRKPQARELTVIAVLCALGVAGRAAFFMLPQFKPVLALTIISGVALGGETGFLVGAVTMLASNVLFSQGPWTPFQMFAMGIIGFLAGVLFRRGWLRRSRAALCVFGAIAAVVIYGGIMNPVSALLYARTLEWKVIAAYYVTGFPMDCVHAAATVFFLWVLAEPMLEKLDRIKVKYGLVE